VGTVARATPARVVGLGDIGAYVEDDTNVLQYPSLISKYAHFTYIDIGGANGVQPSLSEIHTAGGLNGGAFLRFGDFQVGVLTSDFKAAEEGTFLNHVAGMREATSLSGGNAAAIGDLAKKDILRRYDLILGYGSQKDFAAGLRFSFGGFDETVQPPTASKITDPSVTDPANNQRNWSLPDKRWLSQLRLAGGVSVNFGGGALLDATIDYTNFSASFTKNGESTFNGGGGNAIGLAARLRLPLSRFWTLIPQVAYRGWFFGMEEKFTMPGFGTADLTRSIPLDEGRETLEHAMNMHTVDFGAAAELKASKVATFWLALGVGIYSMGTTDSDRDTNGMNKIDSSHSSGMLVWALPYVKFGTEVIPFEWLHARIGAEKYALAASSSTSDTNNLNDPNATKLPNTISTAQSGSIPGTITTQSDFNVYVGTSFILMPGMSIDLLLLNQIFLGTFKNGIAGRASLAYKF
jgi:hypothetical protein